MDLATAEKLINDSGVQKYIEGMDEDADEALSVMRDTISDMADYPGHYISEYEADGSALDDAWGNFNAEWNLIVFKKAKDGKAAMSAYKKYVITLTILEEQNVRFGAYVEADVAGFAALFLALLIELIKGIRRRCAQLLEELKDLQKLLQKAKREVKEAKAQRIINIALTAVSLCIPAVGLGAGIAIAVTTFTVQTVVDVSLGPGNPSALGVLNTAAGDAIGLPKKIKPKFAKLGGIASALYTLKLDNEEIGDAEAIVEKARDKMRTVQATIKSLEKVLGSDLGNLDKHQKNFEKALKEAKSAEKKYKSAESQRLGLLKELNKLK